MYDREGQYRGEDRQARREDRSRKDRDRRGGSSREVRLGMRESIVKLTLYVGLCDSRGS